MSALPYYADYYAVLKVPRDASPHDIERAFERSMAALPKGRWLRLLAWERAGSAWHLREARDVLVDPVRRNKYNEYLRALASYPPPGM